VLRFIHTVDLLQGKLSMAEPLFEKALVIYEESLEPCHPTVSETLRNFALLKYEQVNFFIICFTIKYYTG